VTVAEAERIEAAGIEAEVSTRVAETPHEIVGERTVAFDWPADLFLLQGHYPGFPIVPGVLLVEAAERATQAVAGPLAGAWSGIRSTRFTAPVFPGDRIEVDVTTQERAGGITSRCQVRLGDVQAAAVVLEYGGEPAGPVPSGPAIGAETDPDVAALLPHRYPMLLVDRVRALEPGVGLTATKAVSLGEFCLASKPSTTAYPWPLVVESWCQSAGVLAAWERPNPDVLSGQVMLFGGISGLRFGAPARPGDVLTHHVELVKDLGDVVMMAGHSTAGGRTVMTTDRITMAMRPAEELTRAAAERGGGHGA
jgi:3-hydroxyacyl-[acyl-carrier-protein] dehydratase